MSGFPPAEFPPNNVYWPESINISASWAQYLNPTIDGLNRTIADIILPGARPGTQYMQSSILMSALIANGLSRTSWNSVIQGVVKTTRSNGPASNRTVWNGIEIVDGNYWLSGRGDMFTVDPHESQNWATFRVDSTLQGYGYNAYTVPPRIAIAVMVLYCLLVVGHTVYSGTTGKHQTLSVQNI